MSRKVRLSQCMIVKNEEKNIERALSWGKGIVCEQIVVDTGSTDKTVEIAERMGAKVFHFPWNNDFSAAKNYAIEQATGNWIAFLDADEYFSVEDARKMKELLIRIEQKKVPELKGRRPDFIRTLLVNLDDNGEIRTTMVQDRIFQNRPDLRYTNRIHEELTLTDGRVKNGIDVRKDFTIFHTGYSETAYRETGKLMRNIRMLEEELEQNPDQYTLLTYLGDSYAGICDYEKAIGFYETALNKVESLGKEKVEGYEFIIGNSYSLILMILTRSLEDSDRIKYWHERAVKKLPNHPDIDYFYGNWLSRQNQWEEAIYYLERAFEKLEHYKGNESLYLMAEMEEAYFRLTCSAQQIRNYTKIVQYAVLGLRCNRYQDNILSVLLEVLKKEPKEEETAVGTTGLLKKIYDLNSLKDKLFILKCAKVVGFTAVEDWVMEIMTEEEREFLLR